MADENRINSENLPQGWEAYASKKNEDINLDDVFIQDLVIEDDEAEYTAGASPCPTGYDTSAFSAAPEQGLAAEQFAPSGVIINAETYITKPLKEKKSSKTFVKQTPGSLQSKMLLSLSTIRKTHAKKLIACILAAVITAGAFAAYLYVQEMIEPETYNSVFYQKGSSIMYTFHNKTEPVTLMDNIPVYNKNEYIPDDFSRYLKFNKNKRYILYSDAFTRQIIKEDSTEQAVEMKDVNLYYKDLKSDKPAVIIDSKMSYSTQDFYLTADGKNIIYTDINNNFCIHNLKEKKIIDSNISYIYSFNDENNVIIYNKNNSFYMKHLFSSSSPQKIFSGGNLIYISKDYKTFYFTQYTQNDPLTRSIYPSSYSTVFKKEIGKDSKELLSDITEMGRVYENGDFYFLKKSTDIKINLSDLIIDDMLEADAKMKEPDIYDFELPPTEDSEFTLYDRDAYREAREKYTQKKRRDEIREFLPLEGEAAIEAYDLYYFDGNKETLVCEKVGTRDWYTYKNPVATYTKYEQKNIQNIKLSDENESLYIIDVLREERYEYFLNRTSDNNMFIALREKEVVVPGFKYNYSLSFNSSETKMYYIKDIKSTDDNHNTMGDLMELDIDKETISEPVLIDENVSHISYMLDSGGFYYNKQTGAFSDAVQKMFYSDKTPILPDEYIMFINTLTDSSGLAVIAGPRVPDYPGYNERDQTGNLYIIKGADAIKIADDISAEGYYIPNEKYIAYFMDYKEDSGDLFLYNGETHVRIDTGVSRIFSIYDYYGYGYYN